MTEYINSTNTNPTGTQTGRTICIEKNRNRRKILRTCFSCFETTTYRDEFRKSVRIMQPILLLSSETPTLDTAYLDGIIDALEFLKKERI